MEYPTANLLVVRKTFRTLKDSCFAELKWAIDRLQVGSHWECKLSPLEMTYKPTGQKIYFRGLDDPLKVTSITVSTGSLCWLWIEEAYEIADESDFDVLQESIRGRVADGLFKQITLTFNPWNEHHWLKKRFFDTENEDIFATTTNYMCNEWLDDEDRKMFENMKRTNPRRYEVAGLGNWGIVDGLVYENFREYIFSVEDVLKQGGIEAVFGLDFGYVNDPTALFCGLVDEGNKTLYVFDEIYEKAMTNENIASAIIKKGYAKEKITADCAEPKSIDTLKRLGINRVKPSRKGKDSVMNGIDYLQGYTILIHPKCSNFIKEISSYSWKKDNKTGKAINVPEDDNNHLMDAMRYAMEKYIKSKGIFILG